MLREDNLCIYCGKIYKRIDTHVLLCEEQYMANKKKNLAPFTSQQIKAFSKRALLLNNGHGTKSQKKQDDNNNNNNNNNKNTTTVMDDSSSSEEMMMMIQLPQKRLINRLIGMVNNYNDIEKKITELHSFLAKGKPKKIDILNYLNQYEIVPDISLKEFPERMYIDLRDIEYLIAHSLQETIHKLFMKCLYLLDNVPILAVSKKPAKLFVYHEDRWCFFTNPLLSEFIGRIQFNLSKKLTEWKTIHDFSIVSSEHKTIQYDKTVSKLMAPDFQKEYTCKTYFRMIYSNIKKKHLTEFEIEF